MKRLSPNFIKRSNLISPKRKSKGMRPGMNSGVSSSLETCVSTISINGLKIFGLATMPVTPLNLT